MPTTTPHGLRYPADTDPPDVPTDMQEIAEDVGAWLPLMRRKSAPATRTNTATAAVDTDFSLTLAPGYWRVNAVLHYSGPAAADMRVRWVFTGAGGGQRSVLAPDVSTTNVLAGPMRSSQHTLLNTDVPFGTDGINTGVGYEDLLVSVTSPGQLELWWAQQTANATGTTLGTNSRLIAQRLTL